MAQIKRALDIVGPLEKPISLDMPYLSPSQDYDIKCVQNRRPSEHNCQIQTYGLKRNLF
jgi:hypothetical protein